MKVGYVRISTKEQNTARQDVMLIPSPTRQFYCATPIIAHSPAFRKREVTFSGFVCLQFTAARGTFKPCAAFIRLSRERLTGNGSNPAPEG